MDRLIFDRRRGGDIFIFSGSTFRTFMAQCHPQKSASLCLNKKYMTCCLSNHKVALITCGFRALVISFWDRHGYRFFEMVPY